MFDHSVTGIRKLSECKKSALAADEEEEKGMLLHGFFFPFIFN